MKARSWFPVSLFSRGLALAVLVALPAVGVAGGSALSIVPVDATVVGVVRLDELRTSPISSKLFAETDKMAMDGDAARFMTEAGLDPRKDVDVITFALSPSAGGQDDANALAIFEGRFDTVRLSEAFASRGVIQKTTASGRYFLLADTDQSGADEKKGAVAFVDSQTVLAGTESAVQNGLIAMKNGDTQFTSRSGLGREIGRIDRSATTWILVDVPRAARSGSTPHWGESATGAAGAVSAAMKNVAVIAVWASDGGDALNFGGSALSYDDETRDLLEDTLRGVVAAWRIAAQEKSPELVPVLRGFKVTQSGDAVSIAGAIPGDLLHKWHSKVHSAELH